MKRILVLLSILSSLVAVTNAQSVKATTVRNYTLRTLLNSIDTVIFKHDLYVGVTLYKVSNPSGSAHMEGTDEVSNKYLIAIANGDEDPEINLYQVGDFYDPKILKYELSGGRCHIVIEYGIFKKRKRVDLSLTLKNIVMKNI